MKTSNRALVLVSAALLSVPAHAAFKCVDEAGRTHIGDTPPEQCAKVVMYEVTRSGQVLRTIQPSLTEDQVKARIEAEERKKEADKAAFEQRRKDLALLATYSSEQEFDVVLTRNVEPITGRIKSAQERTAAIDKRVKELDDELEFYKAGKTGKSATTKKGDGGAVFLEEQQRLKHEKGVLAKNVVGYEKEIAEMKAKFEVDKKRWVLLKAGKGGDLPSDAKPAEAKADAKPTEAKAETKAAPKAATKKN